MKISFKIYIIIDRYFYLHEHSSVNTHKDKKLIGKSFITFKVILKKIKKTHYQ